MGACEFFEIKKGQYKDAREAFNDAVSNAAYEHGHGGYSGTIAEKDSFQMVEVPKGTKDIQKFAYDLADNSEGKFWDDKWGPAACVEVTGVRLKEMRGERWKGKRNFHVYYFFGWASE